MRRVARKICRAGSQLLRLRAPPATHEEKCDPAYAVSYRCAGGIRVAKSHQPEPILPAPLSRFTVYRSRSCLPSLPFDLHAKLSARRIDVESTTSAHDGLDSLIP